MPESPGKKPHRTDNKSPMKPIAIAVSLLVNAGILAVLVIRPTLAPLGIRSFFDRDASPSIVEAAHATALANGISASAAKRTDLSTLLATDDLPALIVRLRAAGFPNHAIRAIIEERVKEHYDGRLRALLADEVDAPFWKPVPYGRPSQRWNEQRQLLAERSRVLRELLGNFATSDDGDVTPEQRHRFGNLSPAKIDQLERINTDYAEMSRAATLAMSGITLPGDREQFALLEREKRADLAALLSPQELEDYDRRNSPITARLRPALALFKVTEDEFRAIFEVQQRFADRIELSADRQSGMTPDERLAFLQQRPTAEAELAQAMRAALGEQRYGEFARSSDRDYQQLVRLTERENLPRQAALQAWSVRDQVTQDFNRIRNDAAFSPDQKFAEMQSLAQNTRAHLVSTLGPTAGAAYARSAGWVGNIERTAAVMRALVAQAAAAPQPTP